MNKVKRKNSSSQPKKILISIGQEKIAATISHPNITQQAPLIIFLTGSGGVKERFKTIQQYFSEKGYICVSFDFRGRGESSGKPLHNTLLDQIKDVNTVLSSMVKNENLNKKDITIFGTSMGGFVAASVAQKLKAKNLILSAPAAYLPAAENKPQEAINTYSRILPTLKEKITQSRGLREIVKFTGNLLIIEHEKDFFIPEWLCKKYFKLAHKAKSKKFIVLKDIEHAVLANESWKRELNLTISNWLERLH